MKLSIELSDADKKKITLETLAEMSESELNNVLTTLIDSKKINLVKQVKDKAK